MDRPFDKDIAARPSAKVSAALAKARPKNQPADDPAAPTDASAATLGVSDLAATREVRADLADRLSGVERVAATKGDAGNDEPGGFGDLASLVGTQPSGADAAIADAEAGLAGRFEEPALTEGRERVDAETAIADAKAGLPGSELRESANSMLFEEASNDTTPTGIAGQGTGAVSAEDGPAAPPRDDRMDNINWLKRVFGMDPESTTGATPGPDGVKGTGPKSDMSDVDPVLKGAAEVYLSNLRAGEAMTKEPFKVTPGGTEFFKNAGVVTAEMPDGTKVSTYPDGTRKVTQPDGATTTVFPDGTYKDEPPTQTTKPDAGIPDPEGGDDRFRFISEGLKGRLGPQGVEGGGDIDFGDDIPFGVGSGAQIVDQQGVLLGDAGRAGAVVNGPATSGFQGFDQVRNSGAVDFEDESPLGGGLEDDPFDETGPSQDLDGGLVITDEETTEETETTDASDTSDSTDDTP